MEPRRVPLWPESVYRPAVGEAVQLDVYPLAGGGSRGCVLILPGGGYQSLAPAYAEVTPPWLHGLGYDAAVLHYRLGPRHHHPAMIHDAQRAVRLLRTAGAGWGVRADRLAVLGYSAGGHLASHLATDPGHEPDPGDDLAHVSARPDVAVLCYPVIDLAGPAAHAGSRDNLLGPGGDPAACLALSTQTLVTPDTPPCFLWHTADDPVVPMDNSLMFAAACRAAGVPVELHVYPHGRHGLALGDEDARVATWTGHAEAFLHRCLAPADAAAPQPG